MTSTPLREAREAMATLAPTSGGGGDDVERYARARWSVLTEPGDGVAGQAIARWGAAAALDLALSDTSAPDIPELSERDWRRARARWLPRRDDHAYPLELARRVGARLVIPGDEAWPVRLDDLGVHAPPALWVRGRLDALADPAASVALVGARAATAYGVRVAAELSGDLAAGGVTVVSGAAVGIDAAAHRACVAVEGRGIAVLAGGVEKSYPAGHADLLAGLSRRGVVVSEVPCGTAPTKWRFLHKKRRYAYAGSMSQPGPTVVPWTRARTPLSAESTWKPNSRTSARALSRRGSALCATARTSPTGPNPGRPTSVRGAKRSRCERWSTARTGPPSSHAVAGHVPYPATASR